MTLKNSFLVSLRENNKRRSWVWIVSGLFWFFFQPVVMALLMSRKKNHNLIDNLTGSAAKQRLIQTAGDFLSMNSAVAAFAVLFAVVCAIQGFSYLYSRKKVDMYHSVPVKRSRRFAVIYINGVLMYVIPYTISLILAMLVAMVNGGMNATNVVLAVTAWGMNLLLYLGVYGITILALMLTGNLIITLCGAGILMIYEWVLRGLDFFYKSQFYDYFCSNAQSVNLVPFFSPIGQFIRGMELLEGENVAGGWGVVTAMELLIALVGAAAAYGCYRVRPAEAAGKPLAFAGTKAVIKFLITVPMTLGTAYIVGDVIGDGSNMAIPIIFTLTATAVLSNCMMEVVYEMDIRAAFRKKYQILISGGAAALIYCSFCFDWSGFDAWVPTPEQLSDAVVICGEDTYGSHVDENLNYADNIDYYLSKPGIKDTEAICELSARKTTGDEVIYLTVAYRMKSGRTIWREFPVSADETELLNRVIGSREYKEAACQWTDEAFNQSIKKHKIRELTYDTGLWAEKLATEDYDSLRASYIKDLEQMNYSTYREEYSCGFISMVVYQDKESWVYFEYPVYPSCENTIALLKEKGIYTEGYVNAEEIESITVTNYHRELFEQMTGQDMSADENEAVYALEREDVEVYKTFTDRERIEELLQAMYPYGLSAWWKEADAISSDYKITLKYKDAGRAESLYYSDKANLITQRIPAWLEAETACK